MTLDEPLFLAELQSLYLPNEYKFTFLTKAWRNVLVKYSINRDAFLQACGAVVGAVTLTPWHQLALGPSPPLPGSQSTTGVFQDLSYQLGRWSTEEPVAPRSDFCPPLLIPHVSHGLSP